VLEVESPALRELHVAAAGLGMRTRGNQLVLGGGRGAN
jgi:hypothetical protein